MLPCSLSMHRIIIIRSCYYSFLNSSGIYEFYLLLISVIHIKIKHNMNDQQWWAKTSRKAEDYSDRTGCSWIAFRERWSVAIVRAKAKELTKQLDDDWCGGGIADGYCYDQVTCVTERPIAVAAAWYTHVLFIKYLQGIIFSNI
jgi:hypothetical protein